MDMSWKGTKKGKARKTWTVNNQSLLEAKGWERLEEKGQVMGILVN